MISESSKKLSLSMWWLIWSVITLGLVAVYWTMKPSSSADMPEGIRYVPVLLVAGAVIVRWVVLPRFKSAAKAFPVFILGLSLAEGCGLMGIFVVPDWKAICLALGLLALLQYVPYFASRYEA